MDKKLREIFNQLVPKHYEQYDGEKCFNLFTFIEDFESKITSQVSNLNYDLDPYQIARYLWADIAIQETGQPYPNKFRGLPVLD